MASVGTNLNSKKDAELIEFMENMNNIGFNNATLIKVALYKFMNEYNSNSTVTSIPIPNIIKQEEKQVENIVRETEKEHIDEMVEEAIDEIAEEEIVEEEIEEVKEEIEEAGPNSNKINSNNMAYVNKFKTNLKHKSK